MDKQLLQLDWHRSQLIEPLLQREHAADRLVLNAERTARYVDKNGRHREKFELRHAERERTQEKNSTHKKKPSLPSSCQMTETKEKMIKCFAAKSKSVRLEMLSSVDSVCYFPNLFVHSSLAI